MDFKCFNMNPHHRSSIATLSVLVCTLIYQKMYLSFIIIIPLLLILWIYIILLVRNSFVTNTSIEVNIIDHKEILNTINRSKNFTDSSINGVSKKKIRYHVPKFMLELYEKNKSRDKSASKEPDLVRSLIPTQTEKLQDNDILEELSENHLLIFDIPDSNQDERFIGAELKILTQVEINSKNELGVKKILKISTYDETTRKYCFLREIDYHHFNNTWLSFDLTKEVDTLLQKNTDKKFLKIVITISSYFRQSENNLKLSLLPVVDTFSHDYPILLLSYSIEEETFERQNKISNEKRTNVIRKRRSIDEDYEEETNMIWNGDIPKKNLLKKYKRNNCRRRPLYIEFSEIEYDLWIVQPSGYEAYQCQGKCFYPVADHLSPTKHAIMQALIHSVNPSKASRSCCVPTVLDSISILYVDDKGVLTYRYAYKDMVVLECGCR